MKRISCEKATKAVAYMRTSSATNLGADKDSEHRQRAAISGFAKARGMIIAEWFYDPAVSGVDPSETRPGFAALLDQIEGNGVRVVLIEDPTRFARDLIAQELGVLLLIKRGVRVLTAAGDDLTDTSDPSRVMMRQIAGAFAQYEKARLVARLKRSRDRKKVETGKCGGRRSHAEARPEVVALAKKLRRKRPKGTQQSLREIAAELEKRGYLNERGVRFSAISVANMLVQKQRAA
jgi:DNA invertase Pin-like site-specific DNA recombinase